MDKQALLSSITVASSQKLITKDELLQAFESGKEKKGTSLTRELGISEILYLIGGFIVVLGIIILIAQNWSSLNFFTKVLATLGFGIVAYFLGVLLNKEEKYGLLGYAFHLIAALTIPIGVGVVLIQAGYDTGRAGVQSLIAGLLFAMYLGSFIAFKKTIFTLFSIIYASWFFFVFTNFLIGSNPFFVNIKFYEYRFLLVGLSYMFLGYYFSSTDQRDLTGVLNTFGSFFFLGAALVLGGWRSEQNVFWELVFPALICGVFYLSVRLKSRSYLTIGTMYLMIYILKITGEYFSGTIGWPLSLMIAGIALIATGYYSFTFNKKYLATK